MFSRATRNTVGALAYCTGTSLVNSMTHEVTDYSQKSVQHVEVLLPEYAAPWAHALKDLVAKNRTLGIQKLSDLVESHEKRHDSQVYRELELSLPSELSDEQNIALANEFIKEECCARGMLAIQSFHFSVDEKTGQHNPHCHTLLLTRLLTPRGLSPKKEESWNRKILHELLMKKWAHYQNSHLKRHGFGAEVQCNPYAGQKSDGEPRVVLTEREEGETPPSNVTSKQHKSVLPFFFTWVGSLFQGIKKEIKKSVQQWRHWQSLRGVSRN